MSRQHNRQLRFKPSWLNIDKTRKSFTQESSEILSHSTRNVDKLKVSHTDSLRL